jgi:hypothetical protein
METGLIYHCFARDEISVDVTHEKKLRSPRQGAIKRETGYHNENPAECRQLPPTAGEMW